MEGEFQAGRALGRGVGIWLRNLLPFVALTVLVYLPLAAYIAMALQQPLDSDAMVHTSLMATMLSAGLNLLLTAALMYGVIQQLRGARAEIGECLGVGLRRLFPVLGVAIVCALPFLFGAIFLAMMGQAGGVVFVFSAIVLLVPVAIWLTMTYVATGVAVVERPGVIASIKRSMELTSGYKKQIFGILFLLGLVSFVLTSMVRDPFINDKGLFTSVSDYKTFMWVDLATRILLASLAAAINAVVYHDLRVARDRVATEDLARAFE